MPPTRQGSRGTLEARPARRDEALQPFLPGHGVAEVVQILQATLSLAARSVRTRDLPARYPIDRTRNDTKSASQSKVTGSESKSTQRP
jgi:hypothetical protein